MIGSHRRLGISQMLIQVAYLQYRRRLQYRNIVATVHRVNINKMSQHTLTPTPDLSLPSPLMHPDTDVVNGIHYRKIHKPAPRTRNSTPPAWAWQHG